jgi:hypothetical protein
MMGRVLRWAIDQLIPAVLTAALVLVQRFGLLTLLPLNLVIEREYGNYALLLGVGAALVSSGIFGRVTRQFGVGAFLATALAGFVTITPFVSARYGISFGLPPAHFAMAATFAYLGLYVVIGVLIGGCWSNVVKAFREESPFL